MRVMSLSNCGSSVHMLVGCSSVYSANTRNTGVAAICNSFIILVFTLHSKAKQFTLERIAIACVSLLIQ